MGIFIAVAALAALITGLLIVLPMLRGADAAPSREELDAALYRDQLAEVDRDLERGTISPSEAEGARAEISRRLLAAAQRLETSETPGAAPRISSGITAGLGLLIVPLLGAGIYLATGAPGAPDLPFAERPTATQGQAANTGGRLSQGEAEAMTPASPALDVDPEYARLIERLEERLAANPNDTQGLRLLASGLSRMQRWSEAWQAHDRLIQELGVENAEAELFASMAEAMVMAAGGYVSPEAETILGLALERNRNLPVARYYAGLSLAQNGLVDEAVEVWTKLRAEAPEDAPWLPWLDQMLTQAAQMQAGQQPTQPGVGGPTGGPSQADIAAAENMTQDEIDQQVMGMVNALEERLLTEGGTPEKWNQLINSYMFLSRPEDALRIAGEARQRLGGAALETVETEIARLNLESDDPAPQPAPARQTPRGPTAEDIEAARDMTPEDRQAMIRSMVAGMEERLIAQGGDGEEWFMLLRSYANLGEMEDARRVYELSQQELKGQDAGFLKEQALLLGVITQ